MIFDDFRWFSMIFDDFRWFSMIFRWFCFNICKTNLKINFILSTATVRIRERKRLKNISVTFQNLWHSSICDGVAFVIFHYLLYCRIPYSSGSQTSPVRGPLIIIWWSAKQNILICIGISGPLQPISRTTSGPRRSLWESLIYIEKINGLSEWVYTNDIEGKFRIYIRYPRCDKSY